LWAPTPLHLGPGAAAAAGCTANLLSSLGAFVVHVHHPPLPSQQEPREMARRGFLLICSCFSCGDAPQATLLFVLLSSARQAGEAHLRTTLLFVLFHLRPCRLPPASRTFEARTCASVLGTQQARPHVSRAPICADFSNVCTRHAWRLSESGPARGMSPKSSRRFSYALCPRKYCCDVPGRVLRYPRYYVHARARSVVFVSFRHFFGNKAAHLPCGQRRNIPKS